MYTMNRCFVALTVGLTAVFALAAHAQNDSRRDSAVVLSAPEASAPADSGGRRAFPRNAMRADFVVTASPEITINGRADRLSPGARIRSINNTLVTPATIAGLKYLVNYTREQNGMVHEVWILTEQEARQKLPTQQQPATQQAVDDGKTPYDKLPKW
jgi:hypothetical protein